MENNNIVEEFRKLEGFKNYEVSNFGNVRTRNNNIVNPRLRGKGKYYSVNCYENQKCCNKEIHRLVGLTFLENPDNKPCITHIDGNIYNNNVNNLKWVNNYEKNVKISSRNTSGCKGVSLHKESNKWRATITVNGKHISLGCYTDKEDAISARKQKEEEIQNNDYENSSGDERFFTYLNTLN
jgi:hypothetical protein